MELWNRKRENQRDFCPKISEIKRGRKDTDLQYLRWIAAEFEPTLWWLFHGARAENSAWWCKFGILSGANARIDKSSEQEINCIDLDEPQPRFPRFSRLQWLRQHFVRGFKLSRCVGFEKICNEFWMTIVF